MEVKKTAREDVSNKDTIEKNVIGCNGECPFCGARCEYEVICSKDAAAKEHKTKNHRPMAFKGSSEKRKDANGVKAKHLVDDHCLSPYNLNYSVWPDQEKMKADAFEELERLNKDVQLGGINFILEWSSESDLDLHAKCGCGNWTYTPFSIECTVCNMKRDVDMRTGKSGRKAREHVYFAKPKELIGKYIGAFVQNHLPQGDNEGHVDFKLYAINRYQVVIWPKEGVQEVDQEEWMRVAYENGAESDHKEFVYTKEMDEMGIINFIKKLEQVAKKAEDGVGWEINEANAAEAKQDDLYIQYKDSWQPKWNIVKEILCGIEHYNCQLLENLSVERRAEGE